MLHLFKKDSEEVLSKKFKKLLAEASYLQSRGYRKLYGLKIQEAKSLAKKIESLKHQEKPNKVEEKHLSFKEYLFYLKKNAVMHPGG